MSDERKDYAILISLSMREEAEVMASALRAEGIDALVGNRHHANVDWGYIMALGGMQVLVPRRRIAEAKDVIRERIRDAAENPDGEPAKRRDRWKVWAVIAGALVLGYFGVRPTSSLTMDRDLAEEHRIAYWERYGRMYDYGNPLVPMEIPFPR